MITDKEYLDYLRGLRTHFLIEENKFAYDKVTTDIKAFLNK